MSKNRLDYLIIGPAYPFRGGIADTQHELAKHLQEIGKEVQLLTFSKLYPKFLFPGKNQKTETPIPNTVDTIPLIHAYNPLKWRKIVQYIQLQNPQFVIFRYYTPFLAPLYGWLAKNIDSKIKKVALVDNWIPHERRFLDSKLNRYFGDKMHSFTTLSGAVADQIKSVYSIPLWSGFHPVNTNLLTPISKTKAQKILGWDTTQTTVLFFGLIRKYKGLELLIRAFNQPEIKAQKIVLKIVGECYEDQAKYTQLVARLQLQNSVHFDFEFKSETEIQNIFSACDIVAQTYHTATQSGVTPLAYFYKKPLVVSDINGLNTPIINDGTGVCVNQNPQVIARGILELISASKMQDAVKNITKAYDKYSWSKWVIEWNQFNEKL